MANDLSQAIHLAEMAVRLMKEYENRAREPDNALNSLAPAAWRLADAAGILGDLISETDLIGPGITNPTGRGYTLPRKAEGY